MSGRFAKIGQRQYSRKATHSLRFKDGKNSETSKNERHPKNLETKPNQLNACRHLIKKIRYSIFWIHNCFIMNLISILLKLGTGYCYLQIRCNTLL